MASHADSENTLDEGLAPMDIAAESLSTKNAQSDEVAEESALVTRTDTPISSSSSSSSAPPEKLTGCSSSGVDDREQFSGFRIANRCVPAEKVTSEFQGFQFIRISRLTELGKRAECNRIVIGVLCDWRINKFANGEIYALMVLTDLADPLPRKVHVHLRRKAFEFWRKEPAVKSLTRASIIALMNPALVDPGNTSRDTPAVLRLENPTALVKLGDCPSLGLCAMKGCKLPCNLDLKDRFCKTHLALNYANKTGRSATGGIVASTLKLAASAPKRKQQTSQIEEEAEDISDIARREDIAKRSKIAAALPMSLEERRTGSSDARYDYFKSIRQGTSTEDNDTSRVPKIGRSFSEKNGMEVDATMMKTDEKCKTERLMSRMVEKRAQRLVASNSAPEQQEVPRTTSKNSSNGAEKKSKLGVLLEALKGKREPRRSEDTKQLKEVPQKHVSKTLPTDAPQEGSKRQRSEVNDEEAAIGLMSDLKNAGDDASRIKAVLLSADSLPISVLEGEHGNVFFNAVGALAMHPNNPEIRRAALMARRRWRAASDAAFAVSQTSAAETNAPGISKALETAAKRNNVEPSLAEGGPDAVCLSEGETLQQDIKQADTGNFASSCESGAMEPLPSGQIAKDAALESMPETVAPASPQCDLTSSATTEELPKSDELVRDDIELNANRLGA